MDERTRRDVNFSTPNDPLVPAKTSHEEKAKSRIKKHIRNIIRTTSRLNSSVIDARRQYLLGKLKEKYREEIELLRKEKK